jgi:ribosomal protein S18 acetylase RimI-like enzyme
VFEDLGPGLLLTVSARRKRLELHKEIPMKVRPAEPEDLEVLAVLFDGYRQFYQQKSDLQGAREFLAERLKRKDSRLFIAVSDLGEAAGFAQLYPSFSSISMRPLWILNDLFVGPEFRGRGLGHALLEACVADAKQTGAKGLTLKTARDNESAQSLYEKAGWKRDEQYVSYGFTLPKPE